MGIFKGESMRHMLNCSDESTYHAKVSELELALARRGYPPCVMKRVPYDPVLRMEKMRSFQTRQHGPQSSARSHQNTLVMKLPYSPQLRAIRIRAAYDLLLRELQTVLGSTFLRDTRFVCAHPTSTSLFLDTYGLNYIVKDAPRRSKV